MNAFNKNIVVEFYKSLNMNDVEGALKLFAPQIVRVEFEDSPSGGTYRGLTELRDHFIKGRSSWAEGSCSPEEFIVSEDKIVVFVHVHVRLKDKTEWIDGRVADGFAFKDGKIIEFRSFFKNEAALKWAK